MDQHSCLLSPCFKKEEHCCGTPFLKRLRVNTLSFYLFCLISHQHTHFKPIKIIHTLFWRDKESERDEVAWNAAPSLKYPTGTRLLLSLHKHFQGFSRRPELPSDNTVLFANLPQSGRWRGWMAGRRGEESQGTQHQQENARLLLLTPLWCFTIPKFWRDDDVR